MSSLQRAHTLMGQEASTAPRLNRSQLWKVASAELWQQTSWYIFEFFLLHCGEHSSALTSLWFHLDFKLPGLPSWPSPYWPYTDPSPHTYIPPACHSITFTVLPGRNHFSISQFLVYLPDAHLSIENHPCFPRIHVLVNLAHVTLSISRGSLAFSCFH